MKKKVNYYHKPTDDFAGTNIKMANIDDKYVYQPNNIFFKVMGLFLYYIVVMPIVWFTDTFIFGLRIKNKKVFKKVKNQGVFLYGNHTQILDAFFAPHVCFPRRNYTICHPDAVSIIGFRTIVKMLGGVPLGATLGAKKNFITTLKNHMKKGDCITVYPEAHIWPYYTGIRPFPSATFHYPVTSNSPIVAMATTYRKRSGLLFWMKRPAVTITLSEPFYPDKTLSNSLAAQKISEQVHKYFEKTVCVPSNVEYIKYIQVNEHTSINTYKHRVKNIEKEIVSEFQEDRLPIILKEDSSIKEDEKIIPKK